MPRRDCRAPGRRQRHVRSRARRASNAGSIHRSVRTTRFWRPAHQTGSGLQPMRLSVASIQLVSSLPAAMSARVCFSALHLLARAASTSSALVEGHAQQAVGVADDQVAGMDHHAVDGDRHVDLAGAVLVGAAVRDAGGIEREGAGGRSRRVADCAVEHEAGDAALDRGGGHQFAEQRVGQVAAGVHHDHVARLRHRHRLVDHQVVARAALHGQRGAGQVAALVHRAQARAAGGHARHAVADVGDGQAPEGLTSCALTWRRALEDLESEHGESFVQGGDGGEAQCTIKKQ
jgi:hypothetical protein